MESKSARRFKLGRQSSLKPDNTADEEDSDGIEIPDDMDINFRLMCLASEGDGEAIEELLDLGADVNFKDNEGRTALYVAACQGRTAVAEVLLRAKVDPEDWWGVRCRGEVLVPKMWDAKWEDDVRL